MEEIYTQNLELGEYIYRDNECHLTVAKLACGHYCVTVIGLLGVNGMHYDTLKDLLKAPFNLDKFEYFCYATNQILRVEPIDES